MPKKPSLSPLAEDAQPLEIPESEEIQGVVEIHAVEGDEAPAIPLHTAPSLERETPVPVSVETSTLHRLDVAPVGSKIVVVRREGVVTAVLAHPEGIADLPFGDPAHKLPEGAVIKKVADGKFSSTQLSPAIEYPPLETKSAGEAIAEFVPYFHRTA